MFKSNRLRKKFYNIIFLTTIIFRSIHKNHQTKVDKTIAKSKKLSEKVSEMNKRNPHKPHKLNFSNYYEAKQFLMNEYQNYIFSQIQHQTKTSELIEEVIRMIQILQEENTGLKNQLMQISNGTSFRNNHSKINWENTSGIEDSSNQSSDQSNQKQGQIQNKKRQNNQKTLEQFTVFNQNKLKLGEQNKTIRYFIQKVLAPQLSFDEKSQVQQIPKSLLRDMYFRWNKENKRQIVYLKPQLIQKNLVTYLKEVFPGLRHNYKFFEGLQFNIVNNQNQLKRMPRPKKESDVKMISQQKSSLKYKESQLYLSDEGEEIREQ